MGKKLWRGNSFNLRPKNQRRLSLDVVCCRIENEKGRILRSNVFWQGWDHTLQMIHRCWLSRSALHKLCSASNVHEYYSTYIWLFWIETVPWDVCRASFWSRNAWQRRLSTNTIPHTIEHWYLRERNTADKGHKCECRYLFELKITDQIHSRYVAVTTNCGVLIVWTIVTSPCSRVCRRGSATQTHGRVQRETAVHKGLFIATALNLREPNLVYSWACAFTPKPGREPEGHFTLLITIHDRYSSSQIHESTNDTCI